MDIFDSVDNAKPSGDVFDAVATGPAPKPKGLLSTIGDSFKGAGARMAQGVNESLGSINHAFGMDEGAQMYQENADYWKQKAEEAGSNGLVAKIYTGIGEAPAGVAEFMGNVPYAAAKGAVEGYREDGLTGALSKGALEGAKRLGVGKVFHGIENTGISGMTKAAAMGGTMGAQTAAEQYGATGTINPEDVAASTVTGAFLSLDGGGKAAEVKRNLLNEGVQSDIAQDLSSRTPMTLATARQRLQKSKVEIPDTGITDDAVSVDQAIHAANSELDKPTGGEAISASFLDPAMIRAVEQRKGAPLKGELTPEELRAQDISAAMNGPVLSRDALEEVEANKTDPVLAAAMADGRTRQFDLGESGPLETLTGYRPDFVLKKEGVIEPEVIPPEAAKPVPETEPLALPAPEELKQLPYRGEAAKVPETKEITDAQIPPVAGLSEPVDTQVSPAKGEGAAKKRDVTFANSHVDSYSGQSDYALTINDGGHEVGRLDYSVYEGVPAVKMVEVPEASRRKGYATMLLKELQRQYPNVEIERGMATEDGAKLRAAVHMREVPTEHAHKFKELETLKNDYARRAKEADRFYEIENPTEKQRQDHSELVSPMNDMDDRIWDLERELSDKTPTKRLIVTDDAPPPAPKVEAPAPVEKVEPSVKETTPAPVDTPSATRNVLQQLTSPKRKSDTLVSNLKDAHGKDILNQLAKQEMIRFPGQGRAEVTKAGAKWLEDNPSPRTAKQQERYNILSRKKNLTDKDRATLAELAKLPEAGKEPAQVETASAPQFSVAKDKTDTPEFKRWFGDSKVVGKDGKPLVVYHGTTTDIKTFSLEARRFNRRFGDGFYFTESPEVASAYSRDDDMVAGANVIPVYLSIKKPLVVKSEKEFRQAYEDEIDRQSNGNRYKEDQARNKRDVDILADAGFDGVIYMFNGRMQEIIAFRPEQIKSAIGNNGEFDPANPDIRYSVGDSNATVTPEVLSKVTDVLTKALPDKVDIRVVPSIDYTGPGMDEAFAQHGVKSGKVEGLHQAVLTNGELRSIITLSMDGATERTGYHEVMHAAESLRIIKGKDLAILERAYPTKDGVDASERRADAFADYVSKKEQPANSLIRAMFDRIISFTNRLKSALNGEGWRTADDVFKDLMGGKLKGNAEIAKPSGPQFSVQKDDKPDLIPISDQFRIVRETAEKLNKFADRSKFIKGDVKPTINTAIEGTNVAVDGIRRAVNPMARSDAAEAAGRILIEGMGKMAHDVDKFKGELNKALDQYNEQTGLMAKAKDLLTNSTGIIADKVFAALPEKERYDFMQRMDSGEEQATPELQAIADTVKKMFDEKVEAVQNLGTGALDNARDSYFPHIWERGEDAARQIMAGLSRRPLEGVKGFTKQRVFDDVQAGIDAGYKMVSSNPLDIVFLKMAEMDKYINAHSALQAMEDSGLVQLIPAGEKPHADFSDISGRYGVVTKREAVDPSTGEVNMKSYRYVARDDVAQIFNNYLSQSLYNNKYVGNIYKGYMGAANTLNMFQLGVFSAFHAGFTSHEAVISHASVGMKALSRGDFKTAAKYLAETPAAWVTNPILGDKIIKAWMGGDAPKEMPQIVQWLELAGARRAMDTRFRTNATQKMMEKWSDKQYTGAVIRTIPAIVEQSARPIMEWLVPRQKFGVFGEMANDWVQRHPNATHEELRENMQKIWNRVDSRLGQVVYDRMFLHNVSKNVAQALIRAPGWTGGTILEVGGGTKDLAKYAKDIAFGKKAEMSDRAAYTVSMLAVTGMMNAMLTAAFTGDSPKDWKDLVAFRTGNLDEQGNPERFMLPTYMKDVYAYASDIQSGEPLRTIGHKTHPLLSLMGDIKKNRDYYGVEIRHEGDNPVHQGAQLAGYVAKAFVPFWLRGLQKEQERGGSALAKTAPFIGVMPAPSDMNKSEAEKLAQKLVVERMPNAAKTKEDFDRNQAMKKLTNALRKGEPDASDKIRQAVQDGTITLRQAHNIRNNAKLDPLEVAFKRLGYEEAQKVMEVATDEEKKRLQKIFKKKERNYKMTHPKSRMQNED